MNEITNRKRIREMDADELEEAFERYWNLPFATYGELREMELIEREYKKLTGKELAYEKG